MPAWITGWWASWPKGQSRQLFVMELLAKDCGIGKQLFPGQEDFQLWSQGSILKVIEWGNCDRQLCHPACLQCLKMIVVLTLEVILCLFSDVFWRSSSYLWPFLSPQVSSGLTARIFSMSNRRVSQDEVNLVSFMDLWHFWNFEGGTLGVEGVCDISVYIPPGEEAWSLTCQAISIKGMNWHIPPPPHLSHV